eukprot:6840335-Alexandrium_andersonii.AAC.1
MEPGITGQWLTVQGQYQGMRTLFGQAGVDPSYAMAARFFKKDLTSLHSLQMKMLAPQPTQRPTGQEVLAAASLKLRLLPCGAL